MMVGRVIDHKIAALRITAPVSPLLEAYGRAFMEAGLRPPRKFKTVTGDRAAFHPPRSRDALTTIQGDQQ